jgi:hypothetical protein
MGDSSPAQQTIPHVKYVCVFLSSGKYFLQDTKYL